MCSPSWPWKASPWTRDCRRLLPPVAQVLLLYGSGNELRKLIGCAGKARNAHRGKCLGSVAAVTWRAVIAQGQEGNEVDAGSANRPRPFEHLLQVTALKQIGNENEDGV